MWKEQCLEKMKKLDKSRKGSIDEDIKRLLEKINKKQDYFTTSSCSGRIIILTEKEGQKKYECRWLFVSHKPSTITEVKKALKDIPQEEVWMKLEPPIFHICCRRREKADKIVEIARSVGFKHSGVISAKNKIMVEIISTENVETPIAKEGMLIVTYDYLNFLLKRCNEKLRTAKKRIKKFEESLKLLS